MDMCNRFNAKQLGKNPVPPMSKRHLPMTSCPDYCSGGLCQNASRPDLYLAGSAGTDHDLVRWISDLGSLGLVEAAASSSQRSGIGRHGIDITCAVCLACLQTLIGAVGVDKGLLVLGLVVL